MQVFNLHEEIKQGNYRLRLDLNKNTWKEISEDKKIFPFY